MLGAMATAPRATSHHAPWRGLALALLLVAAAIALPELLDWDTVARGDEKGPFPPLHGYWMPKVAWASLLALALAGLGWRYGESVAARLSWRTLLLTAYAVGLAWLLALALVDGEQGLSRVLGNPVEYLETARETDDIGGMLDTFVGRISYDSDDNWATHVAGHPPGALLFFVALVRVGLGGDLQAGIVVTLIAASVAPAVLVTLRALDAEEIARRAAPFLVLTPAAVFMAVSADAMFAAVAAWGLAALAVAATAATRSRAIVWSVVAGLLLGCCVMLSYGLPLLGLLAIAVLVAARSWRPLPIAGASAVAVVLCFAAGRLRLVGGLPRPRRALLRRDRRRPSDVVLDLGQPGSAAAQRGAAARGRAGASRRERPPGRSHGSPARVRGRSRDRARRPVRDVEVGGGADLAAVHPLADGVAGPASGSLATVGPRPPARNRAACPAPSLHELVATHARSGAVANSRSPWSGVTSAANPSSRRASSGEATMWRTSPRR